jgi:hypothetical protein
MKFIDKLKHAFAVDKDDAPFSDEDKALLGKIADAVVKRQMATPAIMFLESVRPLNFLGSQAIIFFQPVVNFVISTTELEKFAIILEKRSSIPYLIEVIENKDTEQRDAKKKEKEAKKVKGL